MYKLSNISASIRKSCTSLKPNLKFANISGRFSMTISNVFSARHIYKCIKSAFQYLFLLEDISLADHTNLICVFAFSK